jgi:8-amino-7-oxononanoate synthase
MRAQFRQAGRPGGFSRIGKGSEIERHEETILDRLQSHVASEGERIAYQFLKSDDEPERVTYRELDSGARAISQSLLEIAVPGDRALLMFPPGLEFIRAFLGCLYAGVVAVPAYPPKRNRNAARILSMAESCSPRLMLCSEETKRSVEEEVASRFLKSTVLATEECDGDSKASLASVRPSQLAFLQYTSGSTTEPKGVRVTHGNIVANERLIEQCFGFSTSSVMVSWLPMFHDMGLIGGILAPLFVGFPSILMAPNAFLSEPITWLRAVSKFRATCTGAPNFAYDLCVRKISKAQRSELDLSSLRIAYNGSETVRADTLQRFGDSFRECGLSANVSFPCYGMAEATLLVSGGPPHSGATIVDVDGAAIERHQVVPADNGLALVACGQVGPSHQVSIVHPDSLRPCECSEVGEIWVTGPSVAEGYWNQPAETERTFHATLPGDTRHWLRTGDFGFLRDGQLFVTGRLKDLIIIRGRNLYPQDIEVLVERLIDAVAPGSCAAFAVDRGDQGRVVVVAEATRDVVRWTRGQGETPQDLRRLHGQMEAFRERVSREFEVVLEEIVLVRPTTFPKTSSGKLQRQRTRQMYERGELEIVFRSSSHQEVPTGDASASMDRQLHDVVVNWFRAEVDPDISSLDASTSLLALGVDSVGAASLSLRLENEFHVTVTPDLFFDHYTLEKMGELIRQLKRGRSPDRSHPSLQIRSPTPIHIEQEHRKEVRGPQIASSNPSRFEDLLRTRTERVNSLVQSRNYFYETPFTSHVGTSSQLNGDSLLMLASFGYLGLIGHPEVDQAAKDAIDVYGAGAHGVRLVAGTSELHRRLERELARFVSADDALVFSSGYMANVATLKALVGNGDAVFGDEWNHASLVDGCEASGADFEKFRHNDVRQLETLLGQSRHERKLVVVDGVYSMEGDIAPLPDLVDVCRRYQAHLMVDEAHSFTVLGQSGRGIAEHFGLPDSVIDVKMGNLSKGLGSLGGFVAGSRDLVMYLRHHARGYVFSTASGAPVIAAAAKALEILQREPWRVERLRVVARRLVEGLTAAGFRIGPTQSAIIPVLCQSEQQAFDLTAYCRQHGVYVVPITYPAVPMNAPRLRLNVMAIHTDEEIDKAIEVLSAGYKHIAKASTAPQVLQDTAADAGRPA